MTKDEILALRKTLLAAVEERRRLGPFDANADAILLALEASLKVVSHMAEKAR